MIAFSLLVSVISSLVNNVPASIGIGLGVYLVGWALASYLPKKIQSYIFICSALQIGNTDIDQLYKSTIVSVFTASALAFILYQMLRKKDF